MDPFMFTVTIYAPDYDTAKSELLGGIEDARDSGYIEDFDIEDM